MLQSSSLNTFSTRAPMYDDYDLDYAIESICHESSFDLDEYMLDTYDLDEDYMRDSHDYQDLAYRHYA